MNEFEIIVGTHSGDFANAKILCHSIRYFCGDVPISLLVDGEVNVRQILRLGNIRLFDRRPLPPDLQKLTGLYTKFQIFFHPDYDRFLYLDADTLLVQNILTLPYLEFDFLVDGGCEDIDELETRRRITQLCFEVTRLRAFDRNFPYRALITFNAGQFFGRTGRLALDQVVQCIETSSPLHPDGLFKYGDQGILNYLLNKGKREGRFTLAGRTFAIFPSWEPPALFPDLTLSNVVARCYSGHSAIHFTSTRRARLQDYPFRDLVMFFYQGYYARFSPLTKLYDELVTMPKMLERLGREYVGSKPLLAKSLRAFRFWR